MFSRIYFVTFFLGLFFEYTSGQDGQFCFVKKAEPCLAARIEKYTNTLNARNSTQADLQFKELGIQICLTQIRRDIDGRCFETNTDMCPIDQAREIKQTWNNLNDNITDLCEKVCPKFLQIATCKNLTNSEELKDSRFEKFCGSFNESLMCAKSALTDCKFGMDIYYAALEQQFLPYWRQICNSGCPNIDQTIAVIKTCVKPLQDLGSKPAMEDLCNVHYNFKQCVFGSPVVCQKQVMVLISFTYRSYNRIDYMCKTTPVPTTTTTTSTAAVTTRIMTMTSTAFADTKQSTDYGIWSTSTFSEFYPSDVYSNCISEDDIEEMASESHLSASIVLKLMQLEQCIYRNLSADDPVSLYHIPSALLGLYQSYKESGYQVIMEAIKNRCHADVQSGCEGHRYGLIECEPTGAAQCYTPTLLKILTLLILNSIVS